MTREIKRYKIKSLARKINGRGDLGSEADARALWRSYHKDPIHPFLITLPLNAPGIGDGNRRHWGAELEGDIEAEVDCVVFEGEITPESIERAQFLCARHRKNWPLFQKCLFAIKHRDAHPEWRLKDVAADLEIGAPELTKLLMFEKCNERVKALVQEGVLGLRDIVSMGSLHNADEQDALLDQRLGRATTADIERESRKRRRGNEAPAVRTRKIRCPLLSGSVVTVAGADISLEDGIEALGEALKAMKKALDSGLNANTAQRVWADLAGVSK